MASAEEEAAVEATAAPPPNDTLPSHSALQASEGLCAPVFSGGNFQPYERTEDDAAPSDGTVKVGKKVGLIRRTTIGLLGVYKKCDEKFQYQTSLAPRRCLVCYKLFAPCVIVPLSMFTVRVLESHWCICSVSISVDTEACSCQLVCTCVLVCADETERN
jgi:hypothetical protein